MKTTIRAATSLFLALFALGGLAVAQDYGSRGNLGASATEAERGEIEAIYQRFVPYIDRARTELTMVRETVAYAEARGFRAWDPAIREVNAGDRFYAINRDRTMLLWIVGSEPLASGMRLINSHIDSVRLELKPHPLTRKKDAVALDTLVHGGVKAYQWVNVPLGLTGRVDRKDGSVIWIDYGFDENDPVLLIPDLAPHVDRDFRNRTRAEAIEREELDPLITSAPTGGDDGMDAMERAVALIESEFGIEPEDWVSSDIQIVPVTKPREVGMDRALFAAFGLDDRLTGVANVFALEDLETPTHTAMAYLVTDEEVGSSSNISVGSEWFRRVVAEMIRAETGSVSGLDVMECFGNTDMITADTTTATNPLWPSPQAPDKRLAASPRTGHQAVWRRPECKQRIRGPAAPDARRRRRGLAKPHLQGRLRRRDDRSLLQPDEHGGHRLGRRHPFDAQHLRRRLQSRPVGALQGVRRLLQELRFFPLFAQARPRNTPTPPVAAPA